ncbi:MAG: nitroreductase [Pseudomonadota bacterium]
MTPLAPRPDVLDFLLTRRSRPAKTLQAPGPDREALAPLLEAALRVPDHGKLEPWRLLVLGPKTLGRLADLTRQRGRDRGEEPEKLAKAVVQFADAPAMVTVVSAPVDSPKIPEGEQVLSAGAVCLSLVNAALAAGWGANWLTGWMATDRPFLKDGLGLDQGTVAGFVVLGTEGAVPPDRPRPDVAAKVDWRP